MADLNVAVAIVGQDEATPAISKVRSALLELPGSIVPGLGGINALLGVGMVGAAGAASAALAHMVGAAAESQRVSAQTAAVIASTGGAAGVTAQQVGDMATSLSQLTPVDDEVIASAENMLLTFTNIGHDVFPQATTAVLDMATALGEDTQSAAIQLGKALNDPIAGVTALQRVGVRLSDTQKQQVADFMAVNDIAGAQGVILQELQKEFGGSAEAAGQTFAGQVAILKTNIGNLEESIGGALLPTLNSTVVALNDFTRGIEGIPEPADQAETNVYKLGTAVGWLAGHLKETGDFAGDFISTTAEIAQGDVLSTQMERDADSLLVRNDRMADGGRAMQQFSAIQQAAIAPANLWSDVTDKEAAALEKLGQQLAATAGGFDTYKTHADVANVAALDDANALDAAYQKIQADLVAIGDAQAGDVFSRHPEGTQLGGEDLRGLDYFTQQQQAAQKALDDQKRADFEAQKAAIEQANAEELKREQDAARLLAQQKSDQQRALAAQKRADDNRTAEAEHVAWLAQTGRVETADQQHAAMLRQAQLDQAAADAWHAASMQATDSAHLAAVVAAAQVQMTPLQRFQSTPSPAGMGGGGSFNSTPGGGGSPSGGGTPAAQQNFYGDVHLNVQGGVNDSMNQLALMTG